MKLDQDGVVQWTYQVGEALSYSQVNDVAIDASSNVVLAGIHKGSVFGTAVGEDDIVVVKLNSAGVLQWSFQTGSTGKDSVTCVAIDSSGNIIAGGWTRGTIAGETFQGDMDDAVLLKLDSAGTQQWLMATELGTSGRDWISGVGTDASETRKKMALHWTFGWSKIPGTPKTLWVKGKIDPATCGPQGLSF